MADRRVPFPPSALSPVSPEVARAAAAPFASRAWTASAVFLLPALVLMAIASEMIRGVDAEGRRRVLSTGVFLVQLIAAAGAVAVQARRARERIENSEPALRVLASTWRQSLALSAGLCGAFLVAWVALGGAIESMRQVDSRAAGGAGSLGLLRIVPLALAALMAADLAALALLATWMASIRAIEGCGTTTAAAILRGIWSKSRSRLFLHAAVAASATWGTWVAMSMVVNAVYAGAASLAAPGTTASVLLDDALRTWLIATPPLAVLGSAGVASYLLLRPLGSPPA